MPIALALAVALSWVIARTDMPGRRTLEVCLWFSVFIPGISVTLGWILLANAQTGVLNTAIRKIPGFGGITEGPFNIFSFWGINVAHLTTMVPVMSILLIPAFRRMDRALEEAAQVCGANKWRTAIIVTTPLMSPLIISTGLLGFIYSLNAFEIELLLGPQADIQVFSTQIWLWLQGTPPQYGAAAVLGVLFIPMLIVLIILQRYFIGRRSYVTVGSRSFSDVPVRLGPVGRWVVFGVVTLYWFITVLLPVSAVVVGSFMRRFGFFDIRDPFTTSTWRELFNSPRFTSSFVDSIQLGLASAVVGVVLYFLVAYFTERSGLPLRGGVEGMSWLPLAVPGLLLGFGLLWLSLVTPLRTVLYGTLAGLTVAIVIGYMAVGTQQMRAALLQVSPDLDKAARIAGAGPSRAHWFITRPLLAPTIVAVGLLTFNSAVGNIGTVALLSSREFRPMSLILLDYSTQGALEQGAALGVVMCVLTVLVGVIGQRVLGRRPS